MLKKLATIFRQVNLHFLNSSKRCVCMCIVKKCGRVVIAQFGQLGGVILMKHYPHIPEQDLVMFWKKKLNYFQQRVI